MPTHRPLGRSAFGANDTLTDADAALYADLDEIEQMEQDRVIVRPIHPDNVEVDPDIQVRTGGLNPDRVRLLVEVLLNGGEFKDPIETCRLESGTREILADGAHRFEAYQQARRHPDVVSGMIILPPLKSRSHPGGKEAALEIAEEGNLKHGEPLTNEDKKNLLWRRWTRNHPWATLSDREIARQLGINHRTVGRWKEEYLQTNGANAPLRENHKKKIVTKTGQTRDISGVKKANKQRAKTGPTNKQIKRRVIKSLRAAVKGLRELQDHGAEKMDEYVQDLAQEWGIK